MRISDEEVNSLLEYSGRYPDYIQSFTDFENENLKEEWVMNCPDPIPQLAEELQVSENFMRKRLEFEKTI